MFDMAILNGMIVGAEQSYEGDIYIRDGVICQITRGGENNPFSAGEVVDARGKLIFPGLVDVHMHIGEYGADFEDMQTATQAAAAGGVTTCVDMPLNLYSPSILNCDLLQQKRTLLEQEAYVDFSLWGALVPQNLEYLEGLRRAGAGAFKCFLSGGGNDFHAPGLGAVRSALETIKRIDGLAGFHCEDPSITAWEKEQRIRYKLDGRQAFLDSRPLVSELIAVSNILLLARETGAKVHICHISHPEAAGMIEQAKSEGIDVTGETCPHYLTFSAADYLEEGCLFGCAPPLRDDEARAGLWEYVARGVIDCIASDHSPGMAADRDDTHQPNYASGYGISGVQTMLQVIYDQGVNKRGYAPNLLTKALCRQPAKRFGLYGQKGDIGVGFDGDLVIFNPGKEWKICREELYYKQKITAYHGLTGRGCPEIVILRGQLLYQDGELKKEAGTGQFIPV